MAKRGIDNIIVTFDISAVSFMAEAFDMEFVDDVLKKIPSGEVVKCMVCEREMGKRSVGGFFKGKPDTEVCCKNLICLMETTDDKQ